MRDISSLVAPKAIMDRRMGMGWGLWSSKRILLKASFGKRRLCSKNLIQARLLRALGWIWRK